MLAERRALVVDDDVAIRLLLSRVLARSAFSVETARDGAEALEKLATDDYSVIVLDLMMPRIDGVGVIHHLEQFRPELIQRVLVTTAFGSAAVEKLSSTACRFLEKPFDIEHFMAEVNDCCRQDEPDEA